MTRAEKEQDPRVVIVRAFGAPPRFSVRAGSRFGRWTVLADRGTDRHFHSQVETLCECGNKDTIRVAMLLTGQSVQCRSCAHRETLQRYWREVKERRRPPHPTRPGPWTGREVSRCSRCGDVVFQGQACSCQMARAHS